VSGHYASVELVPVGIRQRYRIGVCTHPQTDRPDPTPPLGPLGGLAIRDGAAHRSDYVAFSAVTTTA
jgi:hypothetical protein